MSGHWPQGSGASGPALMEWTRGGTSTMTPRIFRLLSALSSSYREDSLLTLHSAPFLEDERFTAAYRRGDEASPGHVLWRWRVHIGLWAAELASRVSGDFVECGVNRGFLSSAIMSYLDWNSLDKTFYLFDSFDGVNEESLTPEEVGRGWIERYRKAKRAGEVALDVGQARENFSSWERVEIVPGFVPDTLTDVSIETVAFLHLDMNAANPEYEAGRFFWDKLADGGVILMDDFCNRNFPSNRELLSKLADEVDASILALPTGQGVLIKGVGGV